MRDSHAIRVAIFLSAGDLRTTLMDEQDAFPVSAEPSNGQPALASVEATSAEYLGRWNRLVSTTNWEKGRIICQWRSSLLEAGAAVQECSDEAWSRRVGNVSPQHVGRLRRVHEQFGETHDQYARLYWSHFQAVLDWHDAEMWLEGASQNGWSVAQMRTERWETSGASEETRPEANEFTSAELDEDSGAAETSPAAVNDALSEVRDPAGTEEEAGDFDEAGSDAPFDSDDDSGDDETPDPVRPFENLPGLPGDLHDAFESFKLAILNHKLAGWREISRDEVLGVLEALKQLALAPAE
jgi:hypothetical protein